MVENQTLCIMRPWVQSPLAAPCCVLEQGTSTPQSTGQNPGSGGSVLKMTKIVSVSGKKNMTIFGSFFILMALPDLLSSV